MQYYVDQIKKKVAEQFPVTQTSDVSVNSTTPVTTIPMARSSNQEYRKLFAQSVLLFGASGVIWLIFLFVLMPLMIRFAGNIKPLADSNMDDLAPRVPSFSVPQSATNSAQLKITGYGEPDSTIVLVHNGMQKQTQTVNQDGEFAVEFDLDKGENKIAFFSTDEAKNESKLSQERIVTYDDDIPELAWDQPEDKKVITNLREREIKISGQTQERTKVYLNDSIVFVDNSGKFNDTFYLQQGENELTLKVVDEAGNQIEEKRTITFRP